MEVIQPAKWNKKKDNRAQTLGGAIEDQTPSIKIIKVVTKCGPHEALRAGHQPSLTVEVTGAEFPDVGVLPRVPVPDHCLDDPRSIGKGRGLAVNDE